MVSQKNFFHPNAVRVWSGYMFPNLDNEGFNKLLGEDFIPAAVKMQIDTGLKAYIPTVLSGLPNKPELVPDETAILFWDSQEKYKKSFTMLGMRIYSLIHKPVFEYPKSRSGFPILFDGTIADNQPVYLFDKSADWMTGNVKHLVAQLPSNTDPEALRDAIAKTLTTIREQIPLEGAIACLRDGHLVYWELSSEEKEHSGIPLLKEILPDWKKEFTSEPKSIPAELWDDWSGINIYAGCCFNMQFDRRDNV